ncbi:alpha/beta hydrolase [Falsirhodobacter algicola]|uniref:Alpha/beta hydrolase n=1 Tax=Falsirhodobacter algicola TaxID=2692330 RepID=A0A8J8MRZ6_9RHOB|nr:hypothetical protein [Falsirhodobacter algicola]QUS35213.1 hypothetical protein GR316_02340 [Falsirhodobacter algicola]
MDLHRGPVRLRVACPYGLLGIEKTSCSGIGQSLIDAHRPRRIAFVDRCSALSKTTFQYGVGETETGPLALEVDVFHCAGPSPRGTVIWLHSGGFTSGRRGNRHHSGMAQEFNNQGYHAAFPSYRLRGQKPKNAIGWKRLHVLDGEVKTLNEGMKRHHTRRLPMIALDDIVQLLRWVTSAHDEHGLHHDVCLSGSSAGAMTALNTLYMGHITGRTQPENITSVSSASGAFPYATERALSPVPVLALHNPDDPKVPIAPIRRLAAAKPDHVRLIEVTSSHGSYSAYRGEPIEEAIGRIVVHDQESQLLRDDAILRA